MNEIEIDRVPGRIGIDIMDPQLQVSHDLRENEIEQKKSEISIDNWNVKVEVDNYPSYYDSGYRNIKDFLRDMVVEGLSTAQERITKYARQGDRLADFANTDIAEIIKEETAPKEREMILAYKRGPDFAVQPPGLNIEVRYGSVRTNFDLTRLNRPQMNFHRGQIEIYLQQKPELDISVRGGKINTKA